MTRLSPGAVQACRTHAENQIALEGMWIWIYTHIKLSVDVQQTRNGQTYLVAAQSQVQMKQMSSKAAPVHWASAHTCMTFQTAPSDTWIWARIPCSPGEAQNCIKMVQEHHSDALNTCRDVKGVIENLVVSANAPEIIRTTQNCWKMSHSPSGSAKLHAGEPQMLRNLTNTSGIHVCMQSIQSDTKMTARMPRNVSLPPTS